MTDEVFEAQLREQRHLELAGVLHEIKGYLKFISLCLIVIIVILQIG